MYLYNKTTAVMNGMDSDVVEEQKSGSGQVQVLFFRFRDQKCRGVLDFSFLNYSTIVVTIDVVEEQKSGQV